MGVAFIQFPTGLPPAVGLCTCNQWALFFVCTTFFVSTNKSDGLLTQPARWEAVRDTKLGLRSLGAPHGTSGRTSACAVRALGAQR